MSTPTYPGLYRAKAVKASNNEVTALIPQVFGDTAVIIGDFLGAPAQGMGWVFFQAGDGDHPVWCSGLSGGGGAGGTDVVWSGPAAPADNTTELWWDTDEDAPLPAWNAMSLAATWTNYGSGYAPAAYRKIDDVVQLRGLVVCSAGSGTMFTLPAAYRPPYHVMATAWATCNSAAIRAATRLEVLSTGAITVASATTNYPTGTTNAAVTSITSLSLDTITFSVTS